jgi:formate dehydrogenase beta subunit
MVNIIIDEKSYTVDPNQTLLNAAKACGITIPSLCGTDGCHQHCNLCVIEICGQGIVKACQQQPTEGMIITTASETLSEQRKNALQVILSQPNITCCVPPCQNACPAHVDIQKYLYYIAQGNDQKAVDVIKQTLPMPLSVGRICPAFCEAKC